jgi:cytoskeletal protein RodZ
VTGDRPSYGGYSSTDETEQFSIGERPSPWYLKRWVLALWGLAVVTLIAVIIYGLAVLARGNGGSAPAPTTTRTSTPASSHTTTPSTTPSTTEPTTTTTTDVTIEPVPPSASWTPQHPRRHWWRSNLPSIPPVPHF